MALPLFLEGVDNQSMRRKGEQDGSVYPEGKSWMGVFREWAPDSDGKMTWKQRKRKLGERVGPDRITKEEARQKLRDEYISKANGPSAIVRSVSTVKQFAESRFLPDISTSVRTSTKASYEYHLHQHILPVMGDIKLADVTLATIQSLINAKTAKGLAADTVRGTGRTLRALLNHAIDHNARPGPNPYQAKKVKLPQRRKKPKRAISIEQLELLCVEAGPKHSALFYILGALGLRISEALGLKREYCNLTSTHVEIEDRIIPPHSIWIRWNFVQCGKSREWGDLKTRGSDRIVPVTKAAREVLLWQFRQSRSDLVWPNRKGEPLDRHNIGTKHLKPAARKIGCAWLCFHKLRNTAATIADQAGVSLVAIQDVLGHTEAKTTKAYTDADVAFVRQQLESVKVEARWLN